MKRKLSLAFLTVAALVSALAAQQQAEKAQRPKSQLPDPGRPTKEGDELALFSFDEYFAGKWTFDYDVPDGPLRPAGRISGTTVYEPET